MDAGTPETVEHAPMHFSITRPSYKNALIEGIAPKRQQRVRLDSGASHNLPGV